MMELEELNLKIAEDYLDDAVIYLHECREELEKALKSLYELKGWLRRN